MNTDDMVAHLRDRAREIGMLAAVQELELALRSAVRRVGYGEKPGWRGGGTIGSVATLPERARL